MRLSLLCVTVIAALALGVMTAEAGCTLTRVVELPVTMVDMAPVVDAKFNGQPVRLMADSGAFFSMISEASAQQYRLPRETGPPGLRVRGVNGEAEVDVARVDVFSIAGADLHDVEFLVGGTDVGHTGLLGRNLLGIFDTEYDLGGGAIRLFKPRGCGSADLAYWAKGRPETVAPMILGDAPTPAATIRLKVNGVSVRAVLDSGAGDSVLALHAARRLGIDVNAPTVSRAGASAGLGREVVMDWLAPVSSLEIGNETITNTKLRVADIDIEEADMLLGADFFLSHRVLISNSQGKVYITYQGGPVFDLSHHPQVVSHDQVLADIAEPTDAQGYSRRGAAYLDRGDREQALADFSKAVALAPKTPQYLVQRSRAELALDRPAVAMSDVDAALAVDPADVNALIARAALRRTRDDTKGEIADLDAASKGLAPEAYAHLEIGGLYSGADRFDAAVAEFDAWIRYHPEDARLSYALNGRCWARALAGKDLDRALADCNRAVGLYPNNAAVRDSRGLVRLRRGEYGRAIADYDAALKLEPKTAWSLYGRGLAEVASGATDAGRADIAAGEARDPELAGRARRLGLVPAPASVPVAAGPAPATLVAAPH